MKKINKLTVAVAASLFFIALSNNLKAQWSPTWYPGGFNSQTLGAPNVVNAAPWAVGGNKIQNTVGFSGGWNNYTCGTDDGAPFVLMANGIPQINLSGSQIAMGGNFAPSTPGCYVEIKGQGSNYRIFGDAAGTVESTVDMKINYGVNINNLGSYYLNQGQLQVPRFKLDGNGNGTFYQALQVNNQVTAGTFAFTPPSSAKLVANAQNANETGLLVYANNGANGSNALYVANSAGAGRFRMWVNSGGGEDAKMHMAGSAQFGFNTSTGMLDNTTRLNVDGGSLNGVKVSTGFPGTLKSFYIENNLGGSSTAIPFEVLSNGTTHIGTWRPDAGGPSAGALLTVGGPILTTEVRVSISHGAGQDWADYVFAKDYKLMPLAQVKEFTKNESHLPGIPSQKELQKDGLNVGDMQKKQMQKIEELYLYVIQLQEQVDALKLENEKLNAKTH